MRSSKIANLFVIAFVFDHIANADEGTTSEVITKIQMQMLAKYNKDLR